MPYIEIDEQCGASLYYQRTGAGRSIVFVHGALGSHSIWDHQMRDLSDVHDIVTFDWRGVGRSDPGTGPCTIDTVAEDLIGLVTSLELDKPVIVGHGIGNHAVLKAFFEQPELFGRLVLASGAPWYSGNRQEVVGGLPAEFTNWVNTAASGSATLAPDFYAALSRKYMFHNPQSDDVYDWLASIAYGTPLWVLNSVRRSCLGIDHSERLRQINVPVLIVHGRWDEKQRVDGARTLSEQIPGSNLAILDGSAHMVQLDELAKFNDLLREFCR